MAKPKSNTNQFIESLYQFKDWRDTKEDIIGFCSWETVVNEKIMLSCWTHLKKGSVIFMIFADGKGFQAYSYDKDL